MTHALTAQALFDRRRTAQAQRGYTGTGLLKDLSGGLLGLMVDPAALDFNDGAMAITGIISTESEDRSKDVVYTQGAFGGRGLWTDNHAKNPVVFYEHGLKADVPFPAIGLAQTPDGQYTVKKLPTFAVGTTFFHQSTREAVQCYDLARRGVLRGLSLGFKPDLDACRPGPIYGHDENGDPLAGMRIGGCELVEYTHCFLPDNAECLTLLDETLSKNRAAGEPLAPLLYKSLAAHGSPKKVWAPGATLPATLDVGSRLMKSMKMEDDMGRDPLAQGGYVDMEDGTGPANPGDGPAGAGEAGNEPSLELPGAMALKELHDKAMDYKTCAERHMNRQENPSIKAHLDKHCELGEQMMTEHADLHKKEYQENPGFEELGSESPMTEDEQTSFAEDEDGGSEMGQDPEEMTRKRLVALTQKKLTLEAKNQKRLADAEARREAFYFKRFLAKHDKKKLGAEQHTLLTKTLEFLDIAKGLKPEYFTGTKATENIGQFTKVCDFHAKKVAELHAATQPGQQVDAPAPAADVVKALTADRDALKVKTLALLEENTQLRQRLPVLEKKLSRLATKLQLAQVGGPL